MVKMKVALFDLDKVYRERFLAYLTNYKGAEMEIAVFTSLKFLNQALAEEKFHLVILGSGYEEILFSIREQQIPILVLTESQQNGGWELTVNEEWITYMFKYQSMDRITKQIKLTAETGQGAYERWISKKNMEVVVVFSPVKHELQMLFSLLYAKNLGRDGRVLYFNTQEFSIFSEIFGETERDLGDLILEIKKDSIKPEHILDSIYEGEAFSYISPFGNPQDIRELAGTELLRLLEVIADYTDFDTVIWDVGASIDGFEEILKECSRCYCIGKKGYLYEVQMRQFYSYLEKVVNEDVFEKIRELEIPGQIKVVGGGTQLLEKLDWGELGDFVRAKM